jgi:excisionase family DNA binding protein
MPYVVPSKCTMRKGEPMEPLLTIEEASRVLGVKKTTLYTWVYRHQIPSQKVHRLLRFRQSELEVWLKSQARAANRNYSDGE